MDRTATAAKRIVYLTNFLSPDIVDICRHWSAAADDLTILVSVPMEGNRSWTPDEQGLNVRVQKTWTMTRTDRHPSGYRDVNYVHLPLDTFSQLRRRRPDVIVSTELGARSMIAAAYRRLNGRCRHIIAVNTSQHIEASRRGRLRDFQRRRLLRRADLVTFNGPSGRDFLSDLGVPTDKLYPWNYAADPEKIYRGPIVPSDDGRVCLLTVGQLIERKGVTEALQDLIAMASEVPKLRIHWTLFGGGPLLDPMKSAKTPENLTVDFSGNCDAGQIRRAYRDHQVMLFPTLGDEWGLVVDEALHSGLVVIGSRFAQACTTLIRDGVNGWVYDPHGSESLRASVLAWANTNAEARLAMRHRARHSVVDQTAETAARQIRDAIDEAVRRSG